VLCSATQLAAVSARMPRQFLGQTQQFDFAQTNFVQNLPIAMDWYLLES
jgi:hypothetical protein